MAIGQISAGRLAGLAAEPAPATQTNQVVAQLKAECYVALQDWPGLQACVEKGDWEELEFVRHAFKTRALRGEGLSEAANGEWKQAMQAANGQEARLGMLLRLAAQWGWLNEGEEILRDIVNEHPNEDWAREALARSLFASGQTRSLMQLYSEQAARNSNRFNGKKQRGHDRLASGRAGA